MVTDVVSWSGLLGQMVRLPSAAAEVERTAIGNERAVRALIDAASLSHI